MRWTKGAALAAALMAGAADAAAEPFRRIAAAPDATIASLLQDVLDGEAISLDVAVELGAEADWLERAFGAEARGCPFGPLEALGPVSPPTGDHHLLLTLRMGTPERHGANLASCDYVVGAGAPRAVLRLRGCFLVHAVSMPTARQLVLHPLPAASCGAPK